MFKWNAEKNTNAASVPQIKKVNLNGEKQEPSFEQEEPLVLLPHSFNGGEKEYLVLEDVETKLIYYMDIIDTFKLGEHTYSAMLSYESHIETPQEEIVFMRVVKDESASLGYGYEAIYDKTELDQVFDVFFARYEALEQVK